jgi:tellurite resistance protein
VATPRRACAKVSVHLTGGAIVEDYQEAMVKSLVAVAWADGRMEGEEKEVIEALLSAFEISGDDAKAIREYAQTPRTIDDVPLTDLSAHDRRMLLQHAVILTYIDGKQSDDEVAVLNTLVEKLNLPADEAKELLSSAEARAKRLLDLL